MTATSVLSHDPRNNYVSTNPRNSMSIQNSKGLLNMPGQNNCFLNSAVQVLWHLDIFRRSFRDLCGHACMAESCIFCALKELFAQFQYSNESALPPDALRRALAETFFNQQRFQLGHMDDAAECFENILTRIHFHIANSESEDMCSAAHCIPHQKFAMTLVEQSICHSCGATSEPLTFTQMVHYVSASALCSQSNIMEREGKTDVNMFGHLLRKAGGMGDFRDCPSSCGAKIQICRTLINRPDIVSVGVVWDSDHPPLDHILNVFRAIGTQMQLQNVFHSVVDKRWGTSTFHQLVGVVTYYGKHYSTFFFHTKLKVWIYFDDATVREIGPRWEQVIEKCYRGHFQPLLLLYASPNGSPISMEGVPQTVTMVSPQNSSMSMQVPKGKGSPKYPMARQCRTPTPDNVVLDQHHRSTTPCKETEQSIQFTTAEVNNHKAVVRQQSMDDLLISNTNSNSDQYSTYISRKAVENILSQQKLHWQQSSPSSKHSYNSVSAGNRNSNSSLESFENAYKIRMLGNDMKLDIPDEKNIPRRRDSGNWSGDRNSASSASSTSQENQFFYFVGKPKSPLRHPASPKRNAADFLNFPSDAGYDSYSLSSTDSFPSVTSQGKYDIKLCQIPENPLSLINTDHFPPQGFVDDCDRLCFEADQLLLLSQEKENEGDLSMALTLSDCAASKARAAMDAPYNNSKSIMTAKMKHSTCVMRSCSLHRRLAQELKDTTKSSEGRHSRQSSRDSTKSSKSGKEKSSKEAIDKQNKNSIDIYGTLPKKHSRRRCNSSGSSCEVKAAALKAKRDVSERASSTTPTQEIPVKTESKRTVRDVKHEHKHKKLSREDGVKYKEHKKQLLDGYLSVDAADYSDYYSEWDEGKKNALRRTYSGSQTIKDTMKCKDDINYVPQSNKKQHKVRRKLLMGGLIRRKNRSMPDLTDTNDEPFNDFKDCTDSKNMSSFNPESFHSEIESVVQSRGFLQPHPYPALRRSSKLSQPNRLPPPPPVRLPTTKITGEQQTVPIENKQLSKNKSSPTLTTFSVENQETSANKENNPSKSPKSPVNEFPEYMNLPNARIKMSVEHLPNNLNDNCDQILTQDAQNFSSNKFYQHSPLPLQSPNNRTLCQQVPHSPSSPTPQYMNTIDYMSMCKSPLHSPVPTPILNQSYPEYMNLQYFRDSQNNVDVNSGPGSLPLPPPPSPRALSPCAVELPLPPPPEQLLNGSCDQMDSSSAEKPSSFLLELRAMKEELDKKAADKTEVTASQESKKSLVKSDWLQELQAKQVKLKQKKHTEQKNLGPATENQTEKTSNQTLSTERPALKKTMKTKPSLSEATPDHQHTPNTPGLKDGSVRSVKDLASRFEQIMKTPPESQTEPQQITSQPVCEENTQSELQKRPVNQNLDEKIKNLKSPAMRRKADIAKSDNQTYPTITRKVETVIENVSPSKNTGIDRASSPTIMLYTTMTDVELEEIAKCTNKNTQNNALMMSDTTSLLKSQDSFCRPNQPPDYDTAIKLIGQREINNSSLERQELGPKKKRPGRKYVTFSDQVVLVACANGNQEEYMPHPLLEMAFRQHAEKSDSESATTPEACKPSVDVTMCNLCHSQPVINTSELYCSNCSFYMSRFRPTC